MSSTISELMYAKTILTDEVSGIECMRNSLDETFIKAIDILSKSGHIIVSGIGKPGHIARKISATFSSTGSPSFFLHPAEASHGDLGGIATNDALLVFSLSGNTEELVPMLSYASRFGIDVVGVTANSESTLAKMSKVVLIIPKTKEACPHNLAPTTTTTMMAAIGDAMALCLLKRKEFNREDFKKLHPGGTLGKKLLCVCDLMHLDIPIVRGDDVMKSVIIEMTHKAFGCVAIVDENNSIIGIITDGDLRRHISDDLLNMKARNVMTKNPKVVTKGTFVSEAIKIMNQFKITSLFVVENGAVCGILHIHDCLRAGLV